MAPTPRPLVVPGGDLPLTGESLAGLMGEVLGKGRPFRFRARGDSMHPVIRDGDILTVAPRAGRLPRTGDVVAFVHPGTGGVLVHRVIGARAGRFRLKGDNALGADPEAGPETVLGFVVSYERDGRVRRLRRSVPSAALARLSASWWYTRLARRLRRALPRRGDGSSP